MSVASSIASTVARPVCRSVLSLNIGSIAVSYIDSALRNDVVAYSFRRLFADYSGSAFRVRRSSDNAEQDIGFGSDGNLDYATLLSFCGVGSGYVKTWYDQGSASLDATQSTTTRQPRIVDSGSLQLNGAYTAGIKFDGSDDYLMTSSNFDCSATDEASILIGLGSIASLSADTAIAYSSGHVNNRGIGVLSGGTGTTLRIAQFSGGGAYEIKDRSAAESGRRLVGFKCNNSDSSGSRVIPFWNNAYSSTGWTTILTTSSTGNFSNSPITLGAQFSGGAGSYTSGSLDFALFAKRLLTESEMQSISTFARRAGVMVGDSTTAAYIANEVGQYVYADANRFKGCPIQTIAVAGHTIAQQKSAWQSCVQRASAAWVSVQVGLNDCNPADSTTSAKIAAYQDLIDTIRADNPSCKIIGLTMTPAYERWSAIPWDATGSQARWVAINDAIMGRGASPITGLDAKTETHTTTMTTLVSGNAALSATYDTGDHIHTNNAGRAVNAAALLASLETLNLA